MPETMKTGLLVLHGNRMELLAEALLDWLASHPLDALETETILVPSNGMAEWLKMELARAHGVCAATAVQLPARFIWQAYRAVLGREAVPAVSPLDKLPLAWRLMHQLPALAQQPGFEPVRAFLAGPDAARRLQLAQRVADLFDQYQVYRSDWLQDWAAGHDRLRTVAQADAHAAPPVPPDQLWQPALWRALLGAMTAPERSGSRAATHLRFLAALQRAPAPPVRAFPGLPRRIVLFGTTHIPHQTLEAVAALARHSQVLMAVPNPCRHYWADIIDGHAGLRASRQRHAPRNQQDLSALPLRSLHAHAHPLLAAWGRQARDFVRQLDAFDDVQAAIEQFQPPRVDLFDDTPGTTLLEQVQAAIRELMPLAEHPRRELPAHDRSIVFHIAHGAQREVEILHDQLLELLARPPGGQPLHPRDIVVMVPDIDTFAPAIRAVFGQHPRSDPRHIPWGISDQQDRGHQPLLVALEWLLRLPQERLGTSQVRDLLDIQAVSSRFGIETADLPTLMQWIEGAGIRWGLDAAHRDSLGLGPAGETHTWVFGLRRMLLGYAAGELPDTQGFAGIEPYAEVAGMGAGLAGALAELLHRLGAWLAEARVSRTPAVWASCLRQLLADLFLPVDEADRALLGALDAALADWLQACEVAGFDEALPLPVVREAWLGGLDAPGASRRFRAGGVTFCTLLPLRAIPFEVVCLLGMNEGDYPRRGMRSDFDLMALPGQARPGDRSRRDDDRQLMLDALLSARRVLYLSWAGRNPRDNHEQPPSTLVSQLRDYLAGGWGPQAVAQRTTEHPLQPFSRRYFEVPAHEGGSGLFTYASEWRTAHTGRAPQPASEAAAAEPAAPPPEGAEQGRLTLTLGSLVEFLRNPVKAFFRHRLQVSFETQDNTDPDEESFHSGGLERWAQLDALLGACRPWAQAPGALPPPERVAAILEAQLERLQRAGGLPLAGPGRVAQQQLLQAAQPVAQAWRQALAATPHVHDKLAVHLVHPHDDRLALDDWLGGLRCGAGEDPPMWIELQASKVADAGSRKTGPVPRADKLLAAWVRSLASTACGRPVAGLVVGEGACVRVRPPPQAEAHATLCALLQACRNGLEGTEPLPTAVSTGVAWLSGSGREQRVFDGEFGSPAPGEGKDACLARLFPDYASLRAHPGFEAASRALYGPLVEWLQGHVTVTSLEAPSEEQKQGQPATTASAQEGAAYG